MTEAAATDRPEAVRRLAEAADDFERTRERVEEIGQGDLHRLRDAASELHGLLDRYEDTATGSGNFEAFTQFEGAVASLIEGLPEDLPRRETFEAIDDSLQRRRLSTSHFEEARTQLEPIDALVARLDDHEQATEAYADTRRAARRRLDELEDRITHLADLTRLGEADLDAPIEHLRDPIETYNQAVSEAFEAAKHDRPAREFLAALERADAYPLVPFQSPPAELVAYVETAAVGTEPVSKLLEYADYSASKLDHYVADTAALKRAVSTRRTYLERLDAGPLTVDWPPPPRAELPWRCREIRAVLAGFADESVIAKLRTVRNLAHREDYDRLRESARARSQLTDAQRERLASGAVADDLAAAEAERDAIAAALETHGPL